MGATKSLKYRTANPAASSRSGCVSGLASGFVAADEPPHLRLVLRRRHAREVEKHREGHIERRGRHVAAVNVPHRVRGPRARVLPWVGAQLLVILVDRLRDHVQVSRFAVFGLRYM